MSNSPLTTSFSSNGSKADLVRQVLERRIYHGAYIGRDIPAERELADEMQVSRMTARKALQALVDEGKLERQSNGRLVVRKQGASEFALLVPSVSSSVVERFRLSLERVGREKQSTIHTRLYVHWDDPAILESFRACDGVFLIASCEPLSPGLIERFMESGRRLISLGLDLTRFGIPSMDLLPPHALHRILDHLAERGHRAIDCFNTQTCDPIIEARLEQWKIWLAAHRMPGKLLNFPIEPYGSPLERAYKEMKRLIQENALSASALFCPTMPAAIGAVRAMRDAGIQAGGTGARDVAVAAFSDEHLGLYMSPSITSLQTPELDPYLAICLDWMRDPASAWVGSLMMRASEPCLFMGESTASSVTGA